MSITRFDFAGSDAPDDGASLKGDLVWVLLQEGRILLPETTSDSVFPVFPLRFADPEIYDRERHYLGFHQGRHWVGVALPGGVQVPGCYPEDMRRILAQLDESHYVMMSRAVQLAAWRENHQFCSRCGQPTVPHERDKAMVCNSCGYTQYPRITPCVIMLVRRGDQVLLARSSRFTDAMFSCLAGFMEAGETAEHAVAREVFEETAIEVTNVRYFGSQSWPFPHSLMLAFTADYAGGDIRVDDEEIVEADWFDLDNLPRLPPHGSIARSLIDSWLEQLQTRSPR